MHVFCLNVTSHNIFSYTIKIQLLFIYGCILYASGSVCIWVWAWMAEWLFSKKTGTELPFFKFLKSQFLSLNCHSALYRLYPNLTNDNLATVLSLNWRSAFRLKLKRKRNLRYFENTDMATNTNRKVTNYVEKTKFHVADRNRNVQDGHSTFYFRYETSTRGRL